MSLMSKPDVVYHGTRCPRDIITEEGLCFDKRFIIDKIYEWANKLGVSVKQWSVSESRYNYYAKGPRIMRILTTENKRARIHVTDDYLNAVSYSLRNPELLHEAYDNLYDFKHPRRISDSYYKEKEKWVYKEIKKLGPRQVVVIDNTHPDIQAPRGNNRILESPTVPVEAIIKVEHILESDRRNHLNSRMIQI